MVSEKTDGDEATSDTVDGVKKEVKAIPQRRCAELLDRMRSLQLSTTNAEGEPHCGYTPYLYQAPEFFVFVSQLSAHTRDIGQTGKVSVMVIDDETNSPQIFARTRVSYQCEAIIVETEDSSYKNILDAYEARQGKMVGLLRQLPDFTLIRLHPLSGQFVMGFGKAYRVHGEDLDQFEHATTG